MFMGIERCERIEHGDDMERCASGYLPSRIDTFRRSEMTAAQVAEIPCDRGTTNLAAYRPAGG